jgi:ATP-dependent exoDNAse (exonuclease V) alpha subunit
LGTNILKNQGELAAALKRHDLHRARVTEQRISKADVLVLDEVSMMSGDYISMMDFWIKTCRKTSLKPFGGMQVIFTGDFLQLPPVQKRGQKFEYPYAFQSPAWGRSKLRNIALKEVFRQEDAKFIDMLMRVRKGRVGLKHLAYFNEQVGATLKNPTKLFAKNDAVYAENYKHLAALEGEKIEYEAIIECEQDRYAEKLVKDCIAEFQLELKVGAPVLFLRNNYQEGYINGERGVVVDMRADRVTVQKSSGRMVDVERETWEYKDPEGKILATMKQMPLKLAWAMTIHKSQGMTLDLLEVNASECFAPGQTYVALSRAKTFEGLSLTEPLTHKAVKADPVLVDYCDSLGI